MNHSSVLRARVLQFIYFAAYGCAIPFLGLYYRAVLVDSNGVPQYAAVGTVFTISMLVGIASPLAAGYLADRFRIHNRLITMLSLLVVVGYIGIYLPSTSLLRGTELPVRLTILIIGATINGLFVRPILPLMDTESLIALRAKYGDISRYGSIRLFGSLGWIIPAISIGYIVHATGIISVTVLAYIVGFLVLAVIGRTGFQAEIRPVRIPWSHLTKDRLFRRFLVFVLLMSVGITGGYVFTSVYMADLNFDISTIGLAFGLGAIPEIPLLYFGRWFLKRIGNRGMIVVGTFVLALKFLLFFLLAGSGSATGFILAMLLQGAGYSLMYAGMIDFLDIRAHENMRTTYQSLYHTILAVGGAAGNFLASLIMEWYSSKALMAACSVMAGASLIYFILGVRNKRPYRRPAGETG